MAKRTSPSPTKDLFANAVIARKAEPAAAKTKRPTVKIPGLELLASVDSVIASLTTLRANYKSIVDGEVREEFVKEGAKLSKRPENFVGYEGVGSASCELRKRSSASGLSEAEQKVCETFGIPTQVVEDVPETFIINPRYKDDKEVLGKVNKALSKIDLPDDFLMFQESTKKTTTTEASMDKAFTLPEEALRAVLPVISTLAVGKFKVEEDMGVTVARVKDLLSALDESAEPKGHGKN